LATSTKPAPKATDPMPERFGAVLRRMREEAGMTQAQLGFRSNISPTAICRLEAGKREPRLRTIVALANALDMRSADLIREILP
jgi:transcriptional regulator with XRE-family HTH domain